MTASDKKLAAALAAVEMYLEAERALQLAPALPNHIPNEASSWAQTGRMDMMGTRRLLQLRAFPSLR